MTGRPSESKIETTLENLEIDGRKGSPDTPAEAAEDAILVAFRDGATKPVFRFDWDDDKHNPSDSLEELSPVGIGPCFVWFLPPRYIPGEFAGEFPVKLENLRFRFGEVDT